MAGKGGKSTALAILASMPKGKSDEEYESDDTETEDSESDDSESEVAAGEALAEAIQSGDGAAIVAAFKDLKEICKY